MPINKEYVPIDNKPTIKPRTVTGIFTRYIAKTLPLAFDESMSYYECLCALLEYLNETIVPDINNTNEGLEELQEFYEELQTYVNDYFKNLDVQEEINNKLDDMVEDGTLQEIIADYLNSKAVFGYDTVADMKAATNLIDGSYARTLGYHTKNDGGGAIYKISETLPSTYYETLNSGLYAVLNEDKSVVVNQLGAYGDGTHNDSSAIQYAVNNYDEVLFLPQTYLISSTIDIENNNKQTIKGNNTIILISSNIYGFTIENANNKTITDITFNITNGGAIITTNGETGHDLYLKNLIINVESSNNDIIKVVDLHQLKLEDCKLRNNSPLSTPTAVKLDGIVNATINKNTLSYFENGIKFSNLSTKTDEGLIISDNLLYQNKNQIISDNTNTLLFIDINNNIIDFCETTGIKLQNIESSTIHDNYFGINNENCYPLYIRQLNGNHTDLTIDNNKFVNYLQTMVSPTIKINDDGDSRQAGLKILNNHATTYKTFIELYNVSYCPITNNSGLTGVTGNKFILGDSDISCKFSNNSNGGNPLYTNHRLDNLNIAPDYINVKDDISHDTFYKPTNSSGFYLYITFANATATDQLVNIILSKDGANSLLAGNVTVKGSGYQLLSFYVPTGYFVKYNTTTPANIVVQNAHAMY